MTKLNIRPFPSKLHHAPGRLMDCRKGRYANGQVALLLYDAETGEPACKATVAVDGPYAPGPGAVTLKTWSENEGVEETLLSAGIIQGEPLGQIACGHAWASVYRLSKETK